MTKNEEYLRLPHGIYDRDSRWARKEREILDKHDEIGRKIGCEVIKYAPIGYSSTYQRAGNESNEKVYEFASKTGKALMLSCDSTPSVFREYLSSGEIKGKRVSFVAPLFRYRKGHSRHFTQIGYAIINEPKDVTTNIDVRIVELVKSMTDLFKAMEVPIKIYINDYKALRKILKKDFSNDELPLVLHKLQFSTLEERIEFFEENVRDEVRRHQLKKLFSMKETMINGLEAVDNKLKLPDEYLEIYDMSKAISLISDVKIIFDSTNLHSIHTIDNYALRFVTETGNHLGDGGEYTSYAQKYDSRISSFWSVASGVEAIERNNVSNLQEEKVRKVALFNIDASCFFSIQALKQIIDDGYNVTYKGKVTRLSKAIKKLDNSYTHISVIGRNEENKNFIKIKNLQTNEETTIWM